MIDRIVLLQLADEFTSEAALAEIAERSREVLPDLPGVLDCRIGLAADEKTASSWHVSLVLRFGSIDDIPPFAAHPDHRAYVDEYLRPKLAAIVAYNFEVGQGF